MPLTNVELRMAKGAPVGPCLGRKCDVTRCRPRAYTLLVSKPDWTLGIRVEMAQPLPWLTNLNSPITGEGILNLGTQRTQEGLDKR